MYRIARSGPRNEHPASAARAHRRDLVPLAHPASSLHAFGVTRPSELEATARTLYTLAERAVLTPTLDAVTLAESAGSVARASGIQDLEYAAERLAARMAYALGDLTRAEHSFRRASSAAHASGDGLAAARVDASLAFLSYDRGDALAAREQLDGVSASLDALPQELEVDRHRALIAGYRGNLSRQAADYADARAYYLHAIDRAAACDAWVSRATFAMDLGAAELARQRTSEAALWLERSARWVEALHRGPAQTLLRPLVAHYRALLLLSAGQRDPSLVDIDGPSALQPIRAWLYDAVGSPLSTTLRRRLFELGRQSVPFEHARFGVALLAQLQRAEPGDRVLVARDGSLIVREHRITDLSSREPLRRIVEGLARAHPAALDLRALVALGWPAERMSQAAAKNRVHVALSTLRMAGLSDVLVRTPSGYALDPARVEFTR